jgi:ABC-type Fe3+ transport system permease subunit
MRTIFKHGGLLSVLVVLIGALPAWAAGGGGGGVDLVVVADTRVLHNSFIRYIADTYNTNAWLFATWATVLTAVFGAFLGFLMDFLMKRTGIDLKSRKIVEH